MTTAHCSAVTGSAYEAMMIACTWIGVRDDDGRFRGEDGDGDGDGDDDVCEDVLEKEDKMQWKMVITFPPLSQVADHRFPSWRGPPCRCLKCTCVPGQDSSIKPTVYRVSQKIPDRITKKTKI